MKSESIKYICLTSMLIAIYVIDLLAHHWNLQKIPTSPLFTAAPSLTTTLPTE